MGFLSVEGVTKTLPYERVTYGSIAIMGFEEVRNEFDAKNRFGHSISLPIKDQFEATILMVWSGA